MLVYEQDTDILSLLCEIFERFFNGTRFGLGVNDKEIALGVWRIRYVLGSPSQHLRQQSRSSPPSRQQGKSHYQHCRCTHTYACKQKSGHRAVSDLKCQQHPHVYMKVGQQCTPHLRSRREIAYPKYQRTGKDQYPAFQAVKLSVPLGFMKRGYCTLEPEDILLLTA